MTSCLSKDGKGVSSRSLPNDKPTCLRGLRRVGCLLLRGVLQSGLLGSAWVHGHIFSNKGEHGLWRGVDIRRAAAVDAVSQHRNVRGNIARYQAQILQCSTHASLHSALLSVLCERMICTRIMHI